MKCHECLYLPLSIQKLHTDALLPHVISLVSVHFHQLFRNDHEEWFLCIVESELQICTISLHSHLENQRQEVGTCPKSD